MDGGTLFPSTEPRRTDTRRRPPAPGKTDEYLREARIQALAEALLPHVWQGSETNGDAVTDAFWLAEEFVERCDQRMAPLVEAEA